MSDTKESLRSFEVEKQKNDLNFETMFQNFSLIDQCCFLLQSFKIVDNEIKKGRLVRNGPSTRRKICSLKIAGDAKDKVFARCCEFTSMSTITRLSRRHPLVSIL